MLPRPGRLCPDLQMAEELGIARLPKQAERRGRLMAERVVIYTRVSTEEQAKGGTSLAGQKAACLEYCYQRGYTVAKVFVEEGESAKTADRTQLKSLFKYCREERNIKAVIVHKLDRFARNAGDHSQMRTLL